jgi:hypothetical protein
MTKLEMINELIHYTHFDLDDKPEEEIREMYIELFGEV